MAEDVVCTPGIENKIQQTGRDHLEIQSTENNFIADADDSDQQQENFNNSDSLTNRDESNFMSFNDTNDIVYEQNIPINTSSTLLPAEECPVVTNNTEKLIDPEKRWRNSVEVSGMSVKTAVLEDDVIEQMHDESTDSPKLEHSDSSVTKPNVLQNHEMQDVRTELVKNFDFETENAISYDENKQTGVETIIEETSPIAEAEKEPEKIAETENEWLDVLGNDRLKKKIIRKGNGRSSRPLPGDIVEIRYEGKLLDGVVVDSNQQTQFVLSDEDVIQAFDLVVALMEDKEIASVYTDTRYAYGIFGRPDFKPPIPPNSALTYEIEILSIKKGVSIVELPPEERILYGNKKRLRGNDLYSRGDYRASINVYKRGLKYLEGSDDKDVISMRMKCLNNLSAAQLKVKAYIMAIQSLDVVLHYEPKNVKALFRKGKCYDGLGKIEEALDCMKKASEHDSTNKMVLQEIGRLRSRVAVVHQKEKKIYQRMFQQRPSHSSSTENDLDDSETSKWTIVIGSFVVAAAGILAGLAWFKNR